LAWVWARGASKYLGSLLISATIEASNFKFISRAQNKVSTAMYRGAHRKSRGPRKSCEGPREFYSSTCF